MENRPQGQAAKRPRRATPARAESTTLIDRIHAVEAGLRELVGRANEIGERSEDLAGPVAARAERIEEAARTISTIEQDTRELKELLEMIERREARGRETGASDDGSHDPGSAEDDGANLTG